MAYCLNFDDFAISGYLHRYILQKVADLPVMRQQSATMVMLL